MLKARSYRLQAGFTLLELLIVMGIMLVITTLILARHSQFNGTVILRSLAYEMALTIREAQIYGTSGKNSGGIGSQFGVYFSASNPDQYILFGDADQDGAYDSGENIKVYVLGRGYRIVDLCLVVPQSGVSRCSSLSDLTRLSILFKRPNPDAFFSSDVVPGSYGQALITVRSSTGVERSIRVTTTGQISVEQ